MSTCAGGRGVLGGRTPRGGGLYMNFFYLHFISRCFFLNSRGSHLLKETRTTFVFIAALRGSTQVFILGYTRDFTHRFLDIVIRMAIRRGTRFNILRFRRRVMITNTISRRRRQLFFIILQRRLFYSSNYFAKAFHGVFT